MPATIPSPEQDTLTLQPNPEPKKDLTVLGSEFRASEEGVKRAESWLNALDPKKRTPEQTIVLQRQRQEGKSYEDIRETIEGNFLRTKIWSLGTERAYRQAQTEVLHAQGVTPATDEQILIVVEGIEKHHALPNTQARKYVVAQMASGVSLEQLRQQTHSDILGKLRRGGLLTMSQNMRDGKPVHAGELKDTIDSLLRSGHTLDSLIVAIDKAVQRDKTRDGQRQRYGLALDRLDEIPVELEELQRKQQTLEREKTQRGLQTARGAIETQAKRSGLDQGRLREVSANIAENILNTTYFHATEFNGRLLTQDVLKKSGLLPKYEFSSNEVDSLWISDPYTVDGRDAVVGFVKDKSGYVIARSFYRSNSQGGWRYLPNYTSEQGMITWYSKGHSEESINLPFALQQQLDAITDSNAQKRQVSDPHLVFAGTARDSNNPGTFFREVKPKPTYLKGNFSHRDVRRKIPPEQLVFADPNEKPVFSAPIATWQRETPTYGRVQIEVFPSSDGRLRYMFCKDQQGRAWIDSIEDNSKISSLGVRENWIKAEQLTTPAMEYRDYAGGYGNHLLKQGPYVDMYRNYLSRVPIIAEYTQAA